MSIMIASGTTTGLRDALTLLVVLVLLAAFLYLIWQVPRNQRAGAVLGGYRPILVALILAFLFLPPVLEKMGKINKLEVEYKGFTFRLVSEETKANERANL